jgi:hypothetical protein
MIVIDPNDASHDLRVIPRVYNNNANTITLYDENRRTTSTPSNVKAISNGYATYTLSLTVVEGDSFSVKIVEGSTVIWRGRIFATDQTTQSYQING